ncbi:MAG: aminopeptidase N [Micrococcales bacterium]|nr:aminopeptidase N [Micrococcales bacterium]
MTSAPRNENITRAEANARSQSLSVHSYSVDLDLTGTGATFRSTTTCIFESEEPGTATWIDLIADDVASVTLNGRELDPNDVVDGARIALPDIAHDNTVTIVAQCRYMNTGEGLHRFIDPVDDETYLYTQFESADARRMYACFEQPDLKATFQLTVTAPGHWQVISNAPTPNPEAAGPGMAVWNFDASARMSTYITALVAGPYHVVRDSYTGPHGTYPLGVFCRASLAEHLDADDIFELTKQGFAFFEEQFQIPYAFGKYDQLFVPEFNAGAMENAGCVTFLEDFVFRSRVTQAAYEQRANTILHEMAHMWFGDLVTMKWWDDLWLNESFAEWAAHHANVHATRFSEAWTTFANLRKAWAYRQDQLPSTHPIAADMVDLDAVRVNFDGITYAKGASALRQLVAWVGEREFLTGLHEYFTKHAWGNTELHDLLTELEVTSGRDLSQWTGEWLQTSGVNLLRPYVDVDADGAYASVRIEQEPPLAPTGIEPTLRSHRVAIGLYDVTDARLLLRERVEVDVTGASTDVPELIGKARADLLLVNDGDLTFAKVRLDEASWATATAHVGGLTDSLARAVIWGAAWDMTRDAEVSTGDFVQLVLAGIETETDIGVVQGVLRQARMAIDQFAADSHRHEYLVLLARRTLELARRSEPGSDRQLAFTRSSASAATTPEHVATVAALLDGTEQWDGLVIDTDLRWFLLLQLVSAGLRGNDDIATELASDDTATGRRQAATARASVPTAEAKQWAWEEIFHNADLPNAMLEAAIAGFADRDHRDLTDAYLDSYFDALPGVWAERTMEIAQSITMGLFPIYSIEDSTIDRADRFLASDPSPALARLVAEGRDGLLRAQRARERDGDSAAD